MTRITVGVLALQGAFYEHFKLLRKATDSLKSTTWKFIEIRTPEELSTCDALIIPGGESTTVALVASRSGLLEPLRDFVKYALLWLYSFFRIQTNESLGSNASQLGEPALDSSFWPRLLIAL